MGRVRLRIAIEPEPDADEMTIIDAIEQENGISFKTDHNGTLIFSGLSTEHKLERLVPDELAASIDRAVAGSYSSSTAEVTGFYYETEQGALEATDSIEMPSMTGVVFDYFAREYDICVPF